MSKPNPQLIRLILQAASRGRVILAQRKEQTARPVQTPKKVEPNTNR